MLLDWDMYISNNIQISRCLSLDLCEMVQETWRLWYPTTSWHFYI